MKPLHRRFELAAAHPGAVEGQAKANIGKIAEQVQMPAHHRHLQAVSETDTCGGTNLIAPSVLNEGKQNNSHRRRHDKYGRERPITERNSHCGFLEASIKLGWMRPIDLTAWLVASREEDPTTSGARSERLIILPSGYTYSRQRSPRGRRRSA